MEPSRFDAFVRVLDRTLSRRGALAAVLAALPAALLPTPEAMGKGKGRDGGGNRRGSGKARKKGRPGDGRERKQDHPGDGPARCCKRGDCAPGPSKNLAKCCYEGQDLPGARFHGSNLANANFKGAKLRGADFSSAGLNNTCFVNADLTEADLGGTHPDTPIFCNTIMPDGSVNDDDCGRDTACCPTCIPFDRPCGAGIAGACCGQAVCRGPAGQQTCQCPAGTVNCNGVCRQCCDDTNCSGNTPRCCDGICRECCANGDCASAVCCTGVCCPSGQPCVQGACCTPDPNVCQGKCGNVTNTCGQTVNCGPCAERTCQDGACTAQNICDYVNGPDNRPGPNCPAPGFCCSGSCCTAGQVCARLGCCTPESEQATCQGKCGTVENNCGQQVNCGPCAPQTCRGATCTPQNTCAYTVQANNQPGTLCAAPDVCCAGVCCQGQGQVCDTRPQTPVCCTPETKQQTCAPAGQSPRCGVVTNNCGERVNCGPCATRVCNTGACSEPAQICQYSPVPDRTACQTPGSGDGLCCGGSCVDGNCCTNADCSGRSNTCADHTCRCGTGPACAVTERCQGGACVCDAAACAAAGGCCVGNACVRQDPRWSEQTAFGSRGNGPDQFVQPWGVAVSADGRTAWVADTENNRIAVWRRSGGDWVLQTTFGSRGRGPSQFIDPYGVAVSPDGQTAWVADAVNNRVSVWTRSGSSWTNQTTFGSEGDGPDQFRFPRGVAVSRDGQTVWVADADNDRIAVWTRSGGAWIPQTTFGSRGDGRNQFRSPTGVAISGDGQTAWVADAQNQRIAVWTKSGSNWTNQTTFGRRGSDPDQFGNPLGVAVNADGQTVWVADERNEQISVWIKSGDGWVHQTTFGGRSQFTRPAGVAVSADGQTVWVADTFNHRISVWINAAARGNWSNLTTFGSRGDGPNQFGNPRGVAVSADGQTLWVVDAGNDRISVWTKSGIRWVRQTTFGSSGDGPDQFDGPASVAVSGDGQTAWVADTQNQRISVWTKSGSSWNHLVNFGRPGFDPGEFGFPNGVAVSGDGQTAWVADSRFHRIAVWRLAGTGNTWAEQLRFGSEGDGPDQFNFPTDVAVSADGQTVWVTDSENDRISVWVRLGNGSWGHLVNFGGRGPGEFHSPFGVAVSGDGQTVWVADFLNHRISVWTKAGNTWIPQTTFGSEGDGPDQFNGPANVAVSGDGQTVWVADTQNRRISVWIASTCPPA